MPIKRYTFFLFLFAVTCFACKKVDIQFGDQYLDNGYTQLIKIDSFAVDLSTVYVDSFITSAKGASMIGSYNDPVFGSITASSFFEVIPPEYSTPYVADSFKNALFDSIALILKPDNSFFGDTAQQVRINVHTLLEPIVPFDGTNLYSTDSFAVNFTAAGSKMVAVRPNANEPIVIRLNDNIGSDLLKKYQDPNDADVKSNEAFLQYLYGLRVSGDNSGRLVFGCSDSAIVRLYYKKQGLYSESRTLDFTLANKAHHFNHINVDRSGTLLKDLSVSKEIKSAVINNAAYTLYIAGAMAKLRFPNIRDVLKLPNYARILKANLIVRPVRGTYSTKSYILPPSMRLSTTTTLNQIGNDIYYVGSDGSATIQTGNLVTDDLYGENTSYTYDLTKYLLALVADPTYNDNGLLMIPFSPALETQFGRLILGNGLNTGGKTELQIIYAAIQ